MTDQSTNNLAVTAPAGTVVAFAGENIPLGWELCHGQKVRKDDPKYTQLFNAIGTAWGGTGTPFFHLPDLRGVFLRGVSGEDNRDEDKKDRLPARPNDADITNQGNKGNNVGSYQADALQSHTHAYRSKFAQAEGGSGFEGWDFLNNSNPNYQVFHMEATGGIETRPKNVYVHYMIKL